MSVIDVVTQFLATKSSLDWVGHDLYSFPTVESPAVAQETAELATQELLPWMNLGLIKSSLFYPTATGVLLTSIGVVLLKKWRSDADRGSTGELNFRECSKQFDASIRESFTNQSDRTISILEGLIKRIPENEPEILLFFTSEESNVTALKLAVKLMRLILLAKGEDKKVDEIEQEHVANGKEYNSHTIAWHFLEELQKTLSVKRGIVITDFQNVHPYLAALLTFEARNLLCSSEGTYLFLIINTEMAMDSIPSDDSPEDVAMSWWLTNRFGPYFRPEILDEIQKELGECACVIWKEPLSTIIGQ